MSRAPDHYTTLGVAPTATDKEIRQAYRQKALRLHPDKNPNSGDALFKQLCEAYQVLSDRKKRGDYDALRGGAFGAGGGGSRTRPRAYPDPNINVSDIIKKDREMQQRKANLQKQYGLDPQQSVNITEILRREQERAAQARNAPVPPRPSFVQPTAGPAPAPPAGPYGGWAYRGPGGAGPGPQYGFRSEFLARMEREREREREKMERLERERVREQQRLHRERLERERRDREEKDRRDQMEKRERWEALKREKEERERKERERNEREARVREREREERERRRRAEVDEQHKREVEKAKLGAQSLKLKAEREELEREVQRLEALRSWGEKVATPRAAEEAPKVTTPPMSPATRIMMAGREEWENRRQQWERELKEEQERLEVERQKLKEEWTNQEVLRREREAKQREEEEKAREVWRKQREAWQKEVQAEQERLRAEREAQAPPPQVPSPVIAEQKEVLEASTGSVRVSTACDTPTLSPLVADSQSDDDIEEDNGGSTDRRDQAEMAEWEAKRKEWEAELAEIRQDEQRVAEESARRKTNKKKKKKQASSPMHPRTPTTTTSQPTQPDTSMISPGSVMLETATSYRSAGGEAITEAPPSPTPAPAPDTTGANVGRAPKRANHKRRSKGDLGDSVSSNAAGTAGPSTKAGKQQQGETQYRSPTKGKGSDNGLPPLGSTVTGGENHKDLEKVLQGQERGARKRQLELRREKARLESLKVQLEMERRMAALETALVEDDDDMVEEDAAEDALRDLEQEKMKQLQQLQQLALSKSSSMARKPPVQLNDTGKEFLDFIRDQREAQTRAHEEFQQQAEAMESRIRAMYRRTQV